MNSRREQHHKHTHKQQQKPQKQEKQQRQKSRTRSHSSRSQRQSRDPSPFIHSENSDNFTLNDANFPSLPTHNINSSLSLPGTSIESGTSSSKPKSTSKHSNRKSCSNTTSFECKLETFLDLLLHSGSGSSKNKSNSQSRTMAYEALGQLLLLVGSTQTQTFDQPTTAYFEGTRIRELQDVLEGSLKVKVDEKEACSAVTFLTIFLAVIGGGAGDEEVGYEDQNENEVGDEINRDSEGERLVQKLFGPLYNTLFRVLQDWTYKPMVRAKVAIALGIGTFISPDHQTSEKFCPLMSTLMDIAFSGIIDLTTFAWREDEIDESRERLSIEDFQLRSTAFDVISFLGTLILEEVDPRLDRYLRLNFGPILLGGIFDLLDQDEPRNVRAHQDLQYALAAGCCMALFKEREEEWKVKHWEQYDQEQETELSKNDDGTETTDQDEIEARRDFQVEQAKIYNAHLAHRILVLATECGGRSRSKCKKDIRVQRNIFREILNTVVEKMPFAAEKIIIATAGNNVGFPEEVLNIDSWRMKRLYDTFTGILGPGMQRQLAVNPLLRELFDLGPRLVRKSSGASSRQTSSEETRAAKHEKQHANNVNRKAREQMLRRMRQKRAQSFTMMF